MNNFQKMVLSLYSLNPVIMKKSIKIEDVIITDSVGIYTFRFEKNPHSEFEDFMLRYKDAEDKFIKNDFDRIIKAIHKISESEEGAVERFFRTNERKMSDSVVAIPLDTLRRKNHDTLRLYCVRLSDRILIIGNGDTKRGSYNSNPNIVKYTDDLAHIEKAINYFVRKNKITLNYNKIIIDDTVDIKI